MSSKLGQQTICCNF